MNLLKGFREFAFKVDKNPNMVSVAKKQFGIPKKLYLNMPITISNTKLGNNKIVEPTTFYVTQFDDNFVTLTNVQNPLIPEEDPDNEIDLDSNGKIEVTITRKEFEKLQEPQTFQGMDTSMLRMGGTGF